MALAHAKRHLICSSPKTADQSVLKECQSKFQLSPSEKKQNGPQSLFDQPSFKGVRNEAIVDP
jgi:hypothetical protein